MVFVTLLWYYICHNDRRFTFFALVFVAAGALGCGPQLLVLRTGEADVLHMVRLVHPLGRWRRRPGYVPGPLVLARRVGAAGTGPASRARHGRGHELLLAVHRRRSELVLRRVVMRR